MEKTVVAEDMGFAGRTGAHRAHSHYLYCHSEAEVVELQATASAVGELFESAEGCQELLPALRQARRMSQEGMNSQIYCCLP